MRETGVVRRQLNSAEAEPYIGLARTLLGVLKNQMRFGSLSQGWMKQELPDGTVVRVASLMGQDRIYIEAAVPEAPAAAEEFSFRPPEPQYTQLPDDWSDETVSQYLVACGYYDVLQVSSLIPQPYRWTPAGGMVDLALPPGMDQATPRAISADGAVVVGGAAVTGGGSVAVAWVGTRPPVVITAGAAGAAACGVTPTGVVIGFLVNAGFSSYDLFRWTPASGVRVIPGTTTTELPNDPRVSRDGNLIVWTSGSYPNYRVRCQTVSGRVFTAPGALDGYRGIDVSDTGIVLAYKNAGDAVLWNIHTGAMTPLADFNSVSAISPDGKIVTGRWQTDNNGAVWRDGDGTIHQLPPGPQTFVHSDAGAIDTFRGQIIMGGYAAIENKLDNHAPNENEAIWRVKAGEAVLQRIPPSPKSYQANGGTIVDLTIARRKLTAAKDASPDIQQL